MKNYKRRLIKLSFLSIFILSTGLSSASHAWNLPPRLYLWGSGANRLFGEGDAMIPLAGNDRSMFFADITGKYGNDDAWLGSAGLGGRTIIHDNTLLGVYLFTDYNKTPNGKYFTVLDPGIEWMTNEWDAHLNSYIPVGRQSKILGVFTGSQMGISNTTFFFGHGQYDQLFNAIENVGPGADIEIARTFPSVNRARIFAGGYYFSPRYSPDIRGVIAGVDMPLHYRGLEVGIRDSYDNLNHNTFALTLRVRFGGVEKTETVDIRDRMLDLIPRHLGNLRSGDGIPSEVKIANLGQSTLMTGNIWFFTPNGPFLVNSFQGFNSSQGLNSRSQGLNSSQSLDGFHTIESLQNCTFENPCYGLSQTQIDNINALMPNANIYLTPGTYINPNLGSSFSLRNGQNIFGRTANFSQLATGNDRPLLADTLLLEGNNQVYNLRVEGQSLRSLSTGGMVIPFQAGVVVRSFATGDVNIYNTEVAVNSSINNNVIGVGNNSNSSLLTVNNSTMIVNNTLVGGVTLGIGNLRTGTLDINNSVISTFASESVNNFNVTLGIVNNETGRVNISDTSVVVNSVNGGLAVGILNNASLGLGLGTITLNNSSLSVTGDNVNLVGGILNQANSGNGISATMNINQSLISAISNNNGSGTVAGVLASGSGTIGIMNSSINNTADSGTMAGIIVGDPTTTVNFQNTNIALDISGTAVGTPTINGGTLNNNGGNQCFENGVSVLCQ